jgi:hypothetical protein
LRNAIMVHGNYVESTIILKSIIPPAFARADLPPNDSGRGHAISGSPLRISSE